MEFSVSPDPLLQDGPALSQSPPLPLLQIAPVTADVELQIGHYPSDADGDTKRLLRFAEDLQAEQQRVLGFPGAFDFDFSELAPFLRVLVNNVGDPTATDASAVHAKVYEQAVVDFIAELAGAKPAESYGYVTTGGSEGIMRGLQVARAALPHARLYASDQAHYSVRKAAEQLGLQLVTVSSLNDGTMDLQSLRRCTLAHRKSHSGDRHGPGAIVVASIGTTMRGAYDDVTALREAAAGAGDVYIHADAAGGGFVAAYAPSTPRWNFAHGADSVSISGHKFLGTPVPCGVFVARRELVAPVTAGEYVRTTDRTIGCSRSGLAVLLLWSALRRLGHEGLRQRSVRCLETARYTEQQLASAGVNPQRPIDSLTICFDRPAPWIIDKWHLACEGDRAHVITMAHVDRSAIDALRADLMSQAPHHECSTDEV
ncbi:histidine decarboxylase [Kitasatospora sp. MBT63]|uniref:histidine decarboxylase n=1 Tax=Kitasatospora sp. MBT63 TaxID=1444768 RepID=UPI00131410B3|nr:histidine decarboxylase [Kitasatospora sp. MBT63]